MSFEQMMAELREEYVATFPGKIKEIEAHFADLDIENLINDFHKLKGTGKTYGIPEVSIVGELVEKLCSTKVHAPTKFIPTAVEILGQIYVSRLEHKAFAVEACPEYAALLKLSLVTAPN